jgi:uncharacterized cupredoxin-like copper-binding protein
MKTILFAALAVAASASAFVSAKQNQNVSLGHPAACVDAVTGAKLAPAACGPNRFPVNGGERFAAVNLGEGQNLRAVVSNVLIPDAATTPAACPVVVQFFGADGSLVGSAKTVDLNPGTSASVAAKSESGMLRAIVSVHADASNPSEVADPGGICAIRTTEEVFHRGSGQTLQAIPSVECLGNGACEAGLPPVGGS